ADRKQWGDGEFNLKPIAPLLFPDSFGAVGKLDGDGVRFGRDRELHRHRNASKRLGGRIRRTFDRARSLVPVQFEANQLAAELRVPDVPLRQVGAEVKERPPSPAQIGYAKSSPELAAR